VLVEAVDLILQEHHLLHLEVLTELIHLLALYLQLVAEAERTITVALV
jgi:hypothetical protein